MLRKVKHLAQVSSRVLFKIFVFPLRASDLKVRYAQKDNIAIYLPNTLNSFRFRAIPRLFIQNNVVSSQCK